MFQAKSLSQSSKFVKQFFEGAWKNDEKKTGDAAVRNLDGSK